MSKIEEIKEDFHTKYMRERKEKADNFPTKAENFKKKLKELKVKSFSVEYSGSGDSGEINEISWEPKKLKELIFQLNELELSIKKNMNNSLNLISDFITLVVKLELIIFSKSFKLVCIIIFLNFLLF